MITGSKCFLSSSNAQPLNDEHEKLAYMLVHSVQITLENVEISARFVHALSRSRNILKLALLKQQFRINLRQHRQQKSSSDLSKARFSSLFGTKKFSFKPLTNNHQYGRYFTQSLHAIKINEPNNFQLVGANVSKDDIEKPHDGEMPDFQDGLISFKREFSANQVQGWLQARDFSPFLVSFSNYTGMDMLRLSRDDLKTLCGLSEGIRLYNSLHPELLAHKRTIYILIDPESMVYHPIFLYRLTSSELCTKLIALLGLTQSQIADFYLQGPNDIHVIITNELVNHIKDESMFTVDILQDMNGSDRYRLLLKSLASNPEPPG